LVNKNRIFIYLALAALFLGVVGYFGWCQFKEAKKSVVTEETTSTAEVTLYFIKQVGKDVYLWPEKRRVERGKDLLKQALNELIKGPIAVGLEPVLPSSAKVRSVEVVKGIARVDFSREIITESQELTLSAEREKLALVSIANTLTNFPSVERVQILIEGKGRGVVDGKRIEEFWGFVGLPKYLSRDETPIGLTEEVKPPEKGQFSYEEQQITGRGWVIVKKFRYASHDDYFRLIWELESVDKENQLPFVYAKLSPSARLIDVFVSTVEEDLAHPPENELLEIGDDLVANVSWESSAEEERLKSIYHIALTKEAPFYLQAYRHPLRIVLDIKKD
jgi:hypothetical protein